MKDSNPEVSLREVTRETLRAITGLRVNPGQERLVATNAESMAEAHFSPEVAWFRAVYAGDTPVGFVMLSDDAAAEKYYLWRFMIDAGHQGKGIGRKALELLFDYVRTRPGAKVLSTSIVPGAGSPGPFYEKMGFVYTGEEDEGELVMRRELNEAAAETTTTHDGFKLDAAAALLGRTPASLSALLAGLPESWVRATEGEGTWSPYDVVGHLIHGERTDWIPRARHILAGDGRPFEPFDRNAQFAESRGRELAELLATFAALRRENLAALAGMNLTDADMGRRGLHPELGEVTLGQLLATWVVHDLDHVGQIARAMAKAYASAVGPWSAYLSILRDRT